MRHHSTLLVWLQSRPLIPPNAAEDAETEEKQKLLFITGEYAK
jgi:hypothetical protein